MEINSLFCFFYYSNADKLKSFNMNVEASIVSAFYGPTREKIFDLCEISAAQTDR